MTEKYVKNFAIVSNKNVTNNIALATVAQWIECRPLNQEVAGSIPSQGTCLGCRPGPQLGPCERRAHTDVSIPVFLPPFSSL